MKKGLKYLLYLGIGFSLLLSGCAVDKQLGYQAVLTGPGGIPVPNGNKNITVRFWKSATSTNGSDLVYSDSQTVNITNGMFNIAIPDQVSEAGLLDPAKFAQPLWVELTIDGETLSPRQKLLGSAYAFALVGGSVVSIKDGQQQPLVDNFPQRGALNVGNSVVNNNAGSPGTTGLVVTIADATDSEIIRACSGGITPADGCTNAQLKFRVRGDGSVQADGGYTTPAADYAEMIAVEGDPAAYEPGDVLVISTVQDRSVAKSSQANDPRLAGVYSTDPGFLGGNSFEDQAGYIPVAMMGIVPVKVTAANGPIHRGDLLTTSANPGYAMLATDPQFGAVLGKAMGELLEGEGVIEIQLLLR